MHKISFLFAFQNQTKKDEQIKAHRSKILFIKTTKNNTKRKDEKKCCKNLITFS